MRRHLTLFILGTPPAEPPILELMSPGGFEDETIQFYVFAKLVDGTTPPGLFVTVDGFPSQTIFSRGDFENSRLAVQSKHFGHINATFPEDFAGNISLSARAEHTAGNTTVFRTGDFKIIIMPVFDWFDLTANAGCYDESVKSGLINLEVTAKLGDKDNSEVVSLTVEIPPIYSLRKGRMVSEGIYELNLTDISAPLTITLTSDNSFVPFNVKVSAMVTDTARPDISLMRSVETMASLCKGL